MGEGSKRLGRHGTRVIAAIAAIAASAAVAMATIIGGGTWIASKKAPAVAPATTPLADVTGTSSREPIQPIQAYRPQDALGRARVELGARLFSERRLSSDASVSCASCHDLKRGGVDGRTLAVGVEGRTGSLNTPTVFNASLNTKQFWDGRADSLEAQIDGPLTNVNELASSWPALVDTLKDDARYASAFDVAYPGSGVTPTNIRGAIAAYERTLLTTSSRFDRYLRGDTAAISALEKTGYERFKSYGCISCHQGRNVGGNLFEKLGIMGDYFGDRGREITTSDYGRFNVTRREEDRFRFRVPTLRMATVTAPYFHDGSAATLEEAVVAMGKYQLGENITPPDVAAIVAFLGTLVGSYEAADAHALR